MSFEVIEQVLGYSFKNIAILDQAFTHRSYLNEYSVKQNKDAQNNERLEFLGDAVLELIVTDYLYNRYPEFPEGKLTAIRSSLVNYRLLGKIGFDIGFNDFIKLSKGERADNNERSRMPILADCFEAVLGAIYLDGGIEPCVDFIRKYVLSLTENIVQTESFKDSKSRLQEYHQSVSKSTPHYKVLNEEGKEHDKLFTVAVIVDNRQLAVGVGRSKQEAEIEAAANALEKNSIDRI